METLTMSQKELDQITIFEDLKERKMKQKEAAKLLNIGIRQVKRKLKKYRQDGKASLIHKNRGKQSNHSFNEILWKNITDLIREKYYDFGPTLVSEKLFEEHRIKISEETLRLKMITEKIWVPKQRKAKVFFMRERKECFGEMIQLDGSDHDWFEGRAPKCTLLAFIDDATGQILYLEFVDSESTKNLMSSTKTYIEQHGRPLSFYADRGSVFKVNLSNADKDKLTQYERALKELDIELIHARSPQAKGRVERLFQTLQDRLIKELRLKDIASMERANLFLTDEYLAKHNFKFAVKPKSQTNLHRLADKYDMNNTFCLKEERKINNDFTIRYKNKWFQLHKKQPTILFPKETVEVRRHLDGAITIYQQRSQLNFTEIFQRPQSQILSKEKQKPKTSWRPSAQHPWRKFSLA